MRHSHNLVKHRSRSPHDELSARIRVVLVLCIISLSLVLAWTAAAEAKYVWLLFLFTSPVAARLTVLVERSDDVGGATAA